MVLIESDLQNEGESNYKIAQQLFDINKNLDGKTELFDKEINLMIKRKFFATCLTYDGVKLDAMNEEISNQFKRLRVSLKRKGRSEAVQLGKSGESMKEPSYWSKFAGVK